MGAIAGPALVVAVSNATACGVLGRVSGAPVSHLRQQIQHVRTLMGKPLGVNIIWEDAVYTTLFDLGWADAPHRDLRHKVVAEWEPAGRPLLGQRPGEGSIIGIVPRGETTIKLVRYSTRSYPLPGFEEDVEYAVLYAGELCGLMQDIKPAAQMVRDLVRQAEEVIEPIPRG
jgi:NAD(P)H-dependent flavin oxidoreductase YrpB (nitropropane dioxygenase family)